MEREKLTAARENDPGTDSEVELEYRKKNQKTGQLSWILSSMFYNSCYKVFCDWKLGKNFPAFLRIILNPPQTKK